MQRHVAKNYKAMLVVMIVGILSVFGSLSLSYQIGYLSYSTLQYTSIYCIAGIALGMIIEAIYMQSIFQRTFEREDKYKDDTDKMKGDGIY